MNPEHKIAQALLRAWPFPRGTGRIIDRYFSQLSFAQETVAVRTSDGFELTVNPNDLIGRHVYLTGEFDRSVVELICAFAEPNDILLDIGANIGYVSSCFINAIPGSFVVAVEPQPTVLDLLGTNLARFGRHQIYPFALSDRDGDAWFDIHPTNKGASRIVTSCGTRTTRIQTRTGARMFAELNINRVDLVKIDAEGAEEAIIRSCAGQLNEFQPRAIVFEDNEKGMRENGPLRFVLSQINYRVFGIKKTLRQLRLIENDNKAHDYIAISTTRKIPARAIERYQIG
jgi:FkbM family methyltransferase